MPTRLLIALVLCMGSIPQIRAADTPPAPETTEHRDARLHWWREARFGMFIHWGVYSIPAKGEWEMLSSRISPAKYLDFVHEFNPTGFSAERWVAIAKQAGMKYIIITAKHHDGFAMFDSKVSSYNIVDATPFKRDPMKELAAACHAQGIKLGFYYSHSQDWHAAGGAKAVDAWDPSQVGDYDTYLHTVSLPQVTELLTNYGPDVPAILWFDTPSHMTPERSKPFLEALAKRPDLICNNRLDGAHGDYGTPENFIPPSGTKGSIWEACMTMNDSWGYNASDSKWKDATTLIRLLVETVSKDGNFLLNVGPTRDGLIPAPSVERLAAVGAWMAINGESISGAGMSPFTAALPWGRATSKPGKLYLQVFTWPSNGVLEVPMAGTPTAAALLAKPGVPVAMSRTSTGSLALQVGTQAPDPASSVVVLDISSPVLPITAAVAQGADGTVVLHAAEAGISGPSIGVETKTPPNLGFWSAEDDTAYWQVVIDKPGTFSVSLLYALLGGGSDFTLSLGTETLAGHTSGTRGWEDYVPLPMGRLTVAQAGPVLLRISPKGKPAGALMNLRSVTLTPEH